MITPVITIFFLPVMIIICLLTTDLRTTGTGPRNIL
ncbi:unnamed protein product [Brugia timori]|uniref:Uncharacterized protein n=1 Tax=Brugia timori TaxID=42155 RepID=A0A3P7YQZ0_9BILA|nr:unnamed protein product [Brugia timori]